MVNYDLSGKVAVVTGGSRGIGRAIALGMAKAGADVVVASRKLPDLEVVAKDIARLGRRSLAVAAHMRKSEDIHNLVQKVVGEFGRIDIVVNNAGSAFEGSLLEDEEPKWDQIMGVNLKGPFLLSQAAARVMAQQKGGSIIHIASYFGFTPEQKLGIYSISKAGVIMLTKAMANEWGQYNIRVNAVAPGWVKTRLSDGAGLDSEALRRLESRIPLGHMAEPEDIAGPVLFLASEASRYITGHTIVVDGGISAGISHVNSPYG